MKKTILKFGFISGGIFAAFIFCVLPFQHRSFEYGLLLGYTAMVVSFLMVFFGIRSYRNNVSGGQITFGKAFLVGILITLISCACYVIAWEITYFFFVPDFLDKYAAHTIEKLRAQGQSQQVIDATVQQMKDFKVMYNNPMFNAAITFIEPFPVGFVITLISAAILRKKRADGVRSDKPDYSGAQA